MSIVVVEIGPNKFVVGRSVTKGSGYRTLCECKTEGAAHEIQRALVLAEEQSK